jgi:thiol-disulfide isomerase/thioredoxin
MLKTEIIMFTGPGCAACKVMKPIVEKMQNTRVVDVTQEPMLARTYNVRGGLPVFVKLENGDFVDRMSGAVSINILERWAVK